MTSPNPAKKNSKRIPLRQLVARQFPGASKDERLAWILCGDIRVEGAQIRNPGALVPSGAVVDRETSPFVSRGGEKLQAALDEWGISAEGQVCLDAGASTGGFTDALLQAGARCVHAVDVGFNQLAWKLRQDARVISHERTNIMDVSCLDPQPHWAAADLSFRSLRGAAAHVLTLVSEGWMIALMKPQFEWENPDEDFRGVVTSESRRQILLKELTADLAAEGISLDRWMDCPVTGRKGNREFLLLLRRQDLGFE